MEDQGKVLPERIIRCRIRPGEVYPGEMTILMSDGKVKKYDLRVVQPKLKALTEDDLAEMINRNSYGGYKHEAGYVPKHAKV